VFHWLGCSVSFSTPDQRADKVAVRFEKMNHLEFVDQVSARFLADHDIDHCFPTIQSKTFGAGQIKEGDKQLQDGLGFGFEFVGGQWVFANVDQELAVSKVAAQGIGASVLILDVDGRCKVVEGDFGATIGIMGCFRILDELKDRRSFDEPVRRHPDRTSVWHGVHFEMGGFGSDF
jgi:hypothetical protein